MIKICALEFLNRNVFETDVMLNDGRVIYHVGDKITPEIILSLYFKDIFVEEWPLRSEIEQETQDSQAEPATPDFGTVQEKSEEKPEEITFEPQGLEEQKTVEQPEETEEYSIDIKDPEQLLEFDENEAKKVSEYAIMMGNALKLPEKTLKELETAAYYHNIGRIKLKNADLSNEDFGKMQAEAGYSVLLTEMNFSVKVAEVAKFYLRNYDCSSFKLNMTNPSDIPYSHIVAIANYYHKLVNKNIPKEQALKKMLQLGGNKFNIYVLHKFIRIMRET